MAKTYTENQVQIMIANEVAAALSQPTYESKMCDALKSELTARGAEFTGNVEEDVATVASFIADLD